MLTHHPPATSRTRSGFTPRTSLAASVPRPGESVGSYARNIRLDWAARRLVSSDDPLARVACEAGFADQSHFTRAFSRRFGVAPGRYRRAHH